MSHSRLITLVKLFLQTTILVSCVAVQANAQGLLDKRISVYLSRERLEDVLGKIGQESGLYFSYNGNILPKDSLVSIAANNQPLRTVLDQLLGNRYEYGEQNNYVIITPAATVPPVHLSFINIDLTCDDNTCSVSGFVADERTGERLMYASVYEKHQLVSALTDKHGYFSLKFTTGHPGSVDITASKRSYIDTTIHFLQPVLVGSRDNKEAYEGAKNDGSHVENTHLGRLFISTRQLIQSMNIPGFFARRPFQVSLAPGLSSHGMFSPQIVNRFSLNLTGGYTAGVNGLEAGGLFNINRRNAGWVQFAGVFNLVGGKVTGLQAAGVHNRALDTVKGMQLAGFINAAESQVSGIQLSALHNQARKLKGIQVGLVNVADTSEGASIGLVNIIGNGFYKATLFTGSLTNTNLSLKTGTHRFYSSLLTGFNLSAQDKMYSFGLGIGHDIMLGSKAYLSAEMGYQFAYTGVWDDRWTQLKLLLNVQLRKNLSLVAGPTYNRYSYTGSQPGYQSKFRKPALVGFTSNPVQRWMGWEAGLAYNSVFKPVKKITDYSRAWQMGIAITGGIGWDQVHHRAYGAELFVQRDLGAGLCASLSAGYVYFALHPVISSPGNANGPYDHFVYRPYEVIPVKSGVRLQTGRRLYIGGELGAGYSTPRYYRSMNSNTVTSAIQRFSRYSFLYALSAGFDFPNGLDAGIKFEDYAIQTVYKQFAIRLAYKIRLSKK